MTTETTFEDRLLDRLRWVVAANAAPSAPGARQPRRRRWPLAAAGLAAAGVAAALAVVVPGGTQTAYAIDSRPDGTVTVQIASLRDAAGLQAALRQRGIPAIVDYSATCRSVPAPPADSVTPRYRASRSSFHVEQVQASGPGKSARHVGVRVQVSKKADGTGAVTFTIDPGSIPERQNVYITAYSREMNALSIGIGSKAPAPPCPPPTP